MDYKEKKGSYASDSSEKEYKEKEYIIEKREDEKTRPILPTFQQIFHSLPALGGIASFADYHNGIVYFSSLDSHVYAVNAETGELVWKFKTGAPTMSTPLVHNGRIYVGSNDEHFYCLDMDGRLLWKKHTGDIIVSSPSGIGDRIFIGNGKGTFFCFSPSGDIMWKFQTGDGIVTIPSVVNDTVFVGSYDKSIYALDFEGRQKWKFIAGERTSAPLIMDNGKLLFNLSRRSHENSPYAENPQLFCGSYDNHVYALNIDSSVRWKFNCGTSVPGGIGGDNGTIYAGTLSGKIFAIDASDGREKWNFMAGGMITGGAEEKNGMVIFTSFDQSVYCLSERGHKLWSFLTGGPIVCRPLLVGDKAFVGSSDTFLYCLNMKDRSVEWKFQGGFMLDENAKAIIKDFMNTFIEYDRRIFKVWKPETAAGKPSGMPQMTGYNMPQGFAFGGESAYKQTGTYKSEPTYKDKKSPYKK